MRDVVVIKLDGQDYKLPVTFAQYESLDALGLCPYAFITGAALHLRKPVLSLPRAVKVLAIGIPGTTPEALWQAARAREGGPAEVVNAALDYMGAFLTALEDAGSKPPPEVPGSPKETA
jgi:hypothetical protein